MSEIGSTPATDAAVEAEAAKVADAAALGEPGVLRGELGTCTPGRQFAEELAAEDEAADLTAGWRGTNMSDEESFDYHYGKHGAGETAEQYAQDSRDWAANPAGTGKPVKLADGNTGTRYRTPGGGPVSTAAEN